MPVVPTAHDPQSLSAPGAPMDSTAVWLSALVLVVLTATAVYSVERAESTSTAALLCAVLCLIAPVVGPRSGCWLGGSSCPWHATGTGEMTACGQNAGWMVVAVVVCGP
ncbi:hypothetical protein [Corynebacterium antarcticum]|uniref:hypothetical protein n=1 Tax=Corynebacterium antarcticum TaxID=2800405 RepID=UPI002003A90E|nr:hypothetical protein [Corynebacterium antarcticum]MCK7661707.1 hypothetical protein [Corynebacterium antarcticum]